MNVISCKELFFCEDAVTCYQVNILGACIGGKTLCGGAVIAQATAGGFRLPFFRVSVAVKDDSLMLPEGLAYKVLQGAVEISGNFQFISKLPQLFCHNGV